MPREYLALSQMSHVSHLSWAESWWALANELSPHFRAFGIIHALALCLILNSGYALVQAHPGQKKEDALLLVLGWWAASWLVIVRDGLYGPTSFIAMIPALSLLASDQAMRLIRANKWSSRLSSGFVLFAVLQFLSLKRPWLYVPTYSGDEKSAVLYDTTYFAEAKTMGDFIAKQTSSYARLYVFGDEPEILFYARHASAAQQPFSPLTNASLPSIVQQKAVFEEMGSAPPALIVTFLQPMDPTLKHKTVFLFGALKQFLRLYHYHVAALTATNSKQDGYDILSGKTAEAAWMKFPSWPDDAQAPYKVVLWSR